MADNYLERRMEDLRSGRLPGPHGGRSGVGSAMPGHGYIRLKYPPRKVVIASDCEAAARALASEWTQAGSRVALITSDSALAGRMALDRGIRGCAIDPHKPAFAAKAMERTLEAWRGADIFIAAYADDATCRAIAEAWLAYIGSKPRLSDYTPRYIRILAPHEEPARCADVVAPSILSNRITADPHDPETLLTMARTAIFLTAPFPHPISGQHIMI